MNGATPPGARLFQPLGGGYALLGTDARMEGAAFAAELAIVADDETPVYGPLPIALNDRRAIDRFLTGLIEDCPDRPELLVSAVDIAEAVDRWGADPAAALDPRRPFSFDIADGSITAHSEAIGPDGLLRAVLTIRDREGDLRGMPRHVVFDSGPAQHRAGNALGVTRDILVAVEDGLRARLIARHEAAHAAGPRPSRIVRASDGDLAPPDFLIEDVLISNTLAALVGRPGTYKSFVALDLAACILTGRGWAGHATKRGDVLVLAAEGAAGLRRRLRAWEIRRAADLGGMWLLPEATSLLDPQAVDGLAGEIAALPSPPALIVVDTLARHFGGGKENDAGDMGRFFAACDRLRAQTGACVLVIHHDRKDGGYRGSSAFEGTLDTLIAAGREERVVTLTCLKQKDAEEFDPLHFRAHVTELGVDDHRGRPLTSLVLNPTDAATVAQSRPAPERALTANERAALDALLSSPDQRRGYADWQKASGLSKTSFDRARAGLERLGKIRRLEGSGYAPPPPTDPQRAPESVPPPPARLRAWGLGVADDGSEESGGDGDEEAAEPIPVECLPTATRAGAGFACCICGTPIRYAIAGKPLICPQCREAGIVTKLAAD